MITGTLRNLTRLLIAVVLFAGSIDAVCGQDDSQRPLPFPAKEAAEPGLHLELLKRLRSTITDAQQDLSPADTTAPSNAPGATGSRNSDSPGGSPTVPQPAVEEPTPPSASSLQQLGDLFKNLKDQLPKGMIPPSLEQLPPEDMKKGLQAPETQQKLRELLQQFRKDGMLPPEADQETPTKPLPVPPPATNKAVPRGSLKALDEFLQKLQQQATVPDDGSTEPRSEREQPRAEDAAAQTPGNPRQPLRRRDSVPGPRVPAAPETQSAPRTADKPSAADAADPPELPENSGPADTSPVPTQPRSSRKNETQTNDSQQSEPDKKQPSPSIPGASEGALPSEPDVKSPPDPEGSAPGQPGNPQSAAPEKGRNPLRFRPQPGRSPSANSGLPSDDSVELRAKSQAENQGQPAPRSAMDSLQQLMREMSQKLSGNTSRADRSTSEEAPQPEAIAAAPRSGPPPVPAPAPSPKKPPRTSLQNPGASGNGAGQGPGKAPVQRNNSQVPPAVAGPRAQIQSGPRESSSTTNPSTPGQQPRSSTPSQETADAPFSVEQFLNDQLQDPALRSAAESPEARRLLEQIMGQSRTAPDAGSGGDSEPGIAQRGDGPPDSSSSQRSNSLLPRPQDSEAGTPKAPSTDPRNAQRDSDNGVAGNGNDVNGQRRQSEDAGKQRQKQGFAGTLRQIMEEARRETEEQRQRQEEEALAQSQPQSQSQSSSATPADSAPGVADSPNPGTPAAPSGPASSAWNGRERAGDGPTFDPRAALEMLDRFSENMERQGGPNRPNSNQAMSPEGGAGPELPAPQNGTALDRMRDLAGSLLSDRPAPTVPAPVASSEDSAALTQPAASTSFDWTPALILGGILAALMLLIPTVRRLQSRVRVNEEFRATEIALVPHEIRTRQDIVRAFHQLAKRCSRSVRPWWNHLQVATELSRVIPDRQQTVSELSAVYERARYQPLDHELTPAELAAAQMAIRKCAATPG